MDMNTMSNMDMSNMETSITTSSSTSMLMSGTAMHMASTMSSAEATMTSINTHTMSMSGMDMSSMNMPTSTSNTVTPSSTDSSMSGMDMPTSSDSSSSTMQMSMWMTTRYSNTPAFFKSLHANTGAGAFGVFCVLFFCSFFFRGLIFLSAYLEQVIFHNYSNTIIIEEDCECGIEDSKSSPQPPKVDLSVGQIFKKLLWMGPREFINDIVRLLVAFLIAMFGYAIMLAAMSFVVLYFFAICLGLAFAEVFFNKLSIILNINKSFGLH